jgi:hypothetical protein
MNITRTFLALAAGALSLANASAVAAQSFAMSSTPDRGVWMEATHTSFKGFDVDLPTTVWFLGGRLPLTARIGVVADLPYSYARVELLGTTESNGVIGNPYLGLQFLATPRLQLAAGTRLPLTTADEESFADVFAVLSDPERIEAFAEELIPVSAVATYRLPITPAFLLRTHGGITGLFHTGEEAPGPDAAVDYGVLGSYATGPAQLGLGVSGRWFATSDDGSFADNTIHHAALSADVAVAGVRPGIAVRVPLDGEYRKLVSSSITLYLQVPLR